jgi:hypothetical protein
MAGLHEFPTRELVEAGERARLWPERGLTELVRGPGHSLGELAHTITHHRIRAEVRAARFVGRTLPAEARWAGPEELAGLALTGLARKVLALVAPHAVTDAARARR